MYNKGCVCDTNFNTNIYLIKKFKNNLKIILYFLIFFKLIFYVLTYNLANKYMRVSVGVRTNVLVSYL